MARERESEMKKNEKLSNKIYRITPGKAGYITGGTILFYFAGRIFL